MSNVYYDPKKWGLTVVGMIEEPNMQYEFNMLGVWQNKKGEVFYAASSGCSCPTPFEEFEAIDELERINRQSWKNFEDAVRSYGGPSMVVEQKQLIEKVHALVFPVSKRDIDETVESLKKLASSLLSE